MRDLLEILFKRKRAIWNILVFSLLLSFLGNLFSTPLYTSEAKVLIGMGREVTLPTSVLNQPLNVYFNRDEQVNTQIELLSSRYLTELTLANLPQDDLDAEEGSSWDIRGTIKRIWSGTKSTFRDFLAMLKIVEPTSPEQRRIMAFLSLLGVERAGNTEVINVSFTHPDPAFAKAFLERYLQNYLSLATQGAQEEESMAVFTQQADELTVSLDEAIQRLADFRTQWAIYDLSTQKEVLAQDISNTESQLRAVEMNMEAVQSKIEEFKASDTDEVERVIPAELREDAIMIELLKNLVSLKVQLNRTIQSHGPQHPDVQGLRTRLQGLRADITDEVTGILESQLIALGQEKATLEAQIQSQTERARILDEKGMEMEAFEREVELLNQAVSNYGERRETARFNTVLDQARISSVSVVQPPLMPLKPSSPRFLLNLVMAAVLGLLLGVLFAFSAEHLSSTINGPDEMRRLLDVSNVIYVPEMKKDAPSDTHLGQPFRFGPRA